jgi:hypothetical protein
MKSSADYAEKKVSDEKAHKAKKKRGHGLRDIARVEFPFVHFVPFCGYLICVLVLLELVSQCFQIRPNPRIFRLNKGLRRL